MRNITKNELEAALASVKGNTFATLVTVTSARAKKTGNPYGEVFKLSRVNVSLGWHYGNAVNRQLEREGKPADFTPQPRKWGERRNGTPLVDHKGKTYAEAKPERSLGYKYFCIVNGKVRFLTKGEVKPFLPKPSKPATQDGLEKEIRCRDYALDSIRKIVMKGEKFRVA